MTNFTDVNEIYKTQVKLIKNNQDGKDIKTDGD